MTHASAPGKIILFGEHAVVYGQPALAVPVLQVHADVSINAWDSPHSNTAPLSKIWLDASDIGLHSSLADLPAENALRLTVELLLRHIQPAQPLPPLKILVSSSIPVASGLGSGAAVTVALLRALSAHLGAPLPDEEVNQLCYEVEKLHHGTPSGIDNTVITYASPVYFIKGQPIQTFTVHSPFTIVIADTGIAAPTRQAVTDVRSLWQADPTHWEDVFAQVGQIARQAQQSIESGSWPALGGLMNDNQRLLQHMGVSSAQLDELIRAALLAGAPGAKLSGGGRGGNMIALAHPHNAQAIAQALRSAGAKNTLITTIR